MKPVLYCSLAIAVFAAAISAQPYTGDYILGGSVYGTNDAVFRVNRTTLKMTTIATGITPSSTTHYVWEVIMAEDNKHFYALSAHYGAVARIVKLDASGTIVSIIYTGTPALMHHAVNMHLDQNGYLVVFDCSGSTNGPSHFFEIDPKLGLLSTIASMPRGDSFYGSAVADIDTGDYLAFVNDTVFRVDRVTRAVTSLVNTGMRIARMSFAQDTLSGKGYAGTYGAPALFELDLNSNSWKTLNTTNLGGTYGIKFDRRVNATMNSMVVAHGRFSSSPNGISVFDTVGTMTSTTTWAGGTGTPMPYSIEVEGTREVQPILRIPPNGRQIRLSFPGHGGKAYVCAVGISGIRPGLPLGDGRVIYLVLDQIATHCLQGALDPFIPNRIGVLNAAGEATTGLDLNLLGNAVQGMPVVFQVVVLDPSASKGVAVIAEPYTLKLE